MILSGCLCRLDAKGTEKEVQAWVAHRCASVCAAVALFPASLRRWNELQHAQSASIMSSVVMTMSGTAPVQPARKPNNQSPALESPSAQFLGAVMQLQNLCMQCVQQNIEALAGNASAATSRACVPWNMVHAIAMLGEALQESHFSHLHTGNDKVLFELAVRV